MQPGWCQPAKQEFMENKCEALPGVAYPGVRDNRSTINTKTGYDDDDFGNSRLSTKSTVLNSTLLPVHTGLYWHYWQSAALKLFTAPISLLQLLVLIHQHHCHLGMFWVFLYSGFEQQNGIGNVASPQPFQAFRERIRMIPQRIIFFKLVLLCNIFSATAVSKYGGDLRTSAKLLYTLGRFSTEIHDCLRVYHLGI